MEVKITGRVTGGIKSHIGTFNEPSTQKSSIRMLVPSLCIFNLSRLSLNKTTPRFCHSFRQLSLKSQCYSQWLRRASIDCKIIVFILFWQILINFTDL